MRFTGKKFTLVVVSVLACLSSFAQSSISRADLANRINTVTTAVPFLRITGDTRSGGMGDVGIAISPDANGAQLNGAKMAFMNPETQNFGVGLSFTPWLKSLVGDIYLANLTGFYQIKKVQTIHMSLRYFSLGQIQYTDDQGNNTIQVHPNEFFIDAGYSRRFGDIAAVGATLRFIYSNIAPNAGTTTESIKPGIAGAADITVMIDKKFENKKGGDISHELLWGLAITNLGSKMSYTSNVVKDFIPTNLGIGFGYKLHLDRADKHVVGVYLDVNKLLVPTPQYKYDSVSHNNVPSTSYKSQSVIQGAISSFYDAPGGAIEELRSISTGVGAEYFYKGMFGLRMGYFYEHPTKGNRNFLTIGATIKYNVATLHMSYLVPTSNQRNPLDNTFSFSLAFEFGKSKKKPVEGSPADNVAPTPDAGQQVTPPVDKKNKKNGDTKKDVTPQQEGQK
ncbi:MAG: hypothetical protein JWO03_4116 [Bacteroidetes bacterium]|nr:hypothetical protein [Bacteroidota bacterium]